MLHYTSLFHTALNALDIGAVLDFHKTGMDWPHYADNASSLCSTGPITENKEHFFVLKKKKN